MTTETKTFCDRCKKEFKSWDCFGFEFTAKYSIFPFHRKNFDFCQECFKEVEKFAQGGK